MSLARSLFLTGLTHRARVLPRIGTEKAIADAGIGEICGVRDCFGSHCASPTRKAMKTHRYGKMIWRTLPVDGVLHWTYPPALRKT